MSEDVMNFALSPGTIVPARRSGAGPSAPAGYRGRWSRCSVPADASLAEAYKVVAHDIRAAAALRLEALGGSYEPPLVITANDHAVWLRAGQPDGDLKI